MLQSSRDESWSHSVVSAEKMIEIGLELGYLPENAPLASRHELRDLPLLEKQLVIAAGCQADPRSTMNRIAAKEHPILTMDSGDELIYSRTKDPGQ